MKLRIRLLCAAILCSLPIGPPCAAADTAPARPQLVALRAARLFDGKGEALLERATVLVEGGTIRAVGTDLAVPPEASVIELGDVTLLPGLIDCHVHIAGESTDDWYRGEVEHLRRTAAENALRAVPFARRTLEAGFTTVRNLGAGEHVDVALRNAARAGSIAAPTIVASAYSLGSRGGHCDDTGYPYQRFGPEPGPERGIAAGADGFRDAVRFQVKYGADVIKVCATGGVLSLSDEVDTPQLTQEEMNALVDEAHRLRKKAAAHAHGAEGAKVAIRAGIDSIEHGSFLDDEALEMMKQHGTTLVPTFMAVHSVRTKAQAGLYPPEIAEKALAAAASHLGVLRKAVQKGVRIAFGTDSGVSAHGLNAQEFALMVDAGMTPAAARRSATSVAAELLGREARIGTLEPGKAADLVAVPGNPLQDIRRMEQVFFVMKAGQVVRHDPPASPR